MKIRYLIPIVALLLAGAGCQNINNDTDSSWLDEIPTIKEENQSMFTEYVDEINDLCMMPIGELTAVEFRRCHDSDLDQSFYDMLGILPTPREYEHLPAFCDRQITEMSAFEFTDCLADEPEIYE